MCVCCGGCGCGCVVCVCWVGGRVVDTSLALARGCCILYVVLVCVSFPGTSFSIIFSNFKIKCFILLFGKLLCFLCMCVLPVFSLCTWCVREGGEGVVTCNSFNINWGSLFSMQVASDRPACSPGCSEAVSPCSDASTAVLRLL